MMSQMSVMRRESIAATFLVLASVLGCDRKDSGATRNGGQQAEVSVSDSGYAKARAEAVSKYAGSPVTPIRSADDFIGAWEMRFGGPVGSDKVEWVYEFSRDGNVTVGGRETWRWKLSADGTLSFFVTIPPDPKAPGLEDGASSEEVRHPFKAADGRIVLSNEDTSVIELLSKVTARPGKGGR